MFEFFKKHPVLRQIAIESTFPAIIALIWTSSEIHNHRADHEFGIWAGIKVFTSTFAAASWVLSQILRIFNQRNTKEHFIDIKKRTDDIFNSLENRTQELVDQITGGTSYPRFLLSAYEDTTTIDVTLDHRGRHALLDLQVEIASISSFEYNSETKTRIFGSGNIINNEYISALQPKTTMQLRRISVENTNERLFLIRCRARNGTTEQIISMRRFPNWKNGWAHQSWIFTSWNEVHLERNIPPGTEAWPTNSNSNLHVSVQPN